MNRQTRQLLNKVLPKNNKKLIIQVGRIFQLLQKGPVGNLEEDELISSIFQIGLNIVKEELCKRYRHVPRAR